MQEAAEISKFKAVKSVGSPPARAVTETCCQKRKKSFEREGGKLPGPQSRQETRQGESTLLLPKQRSSQQAASLPVTEV